MESVVPWAALVDLIASYYPDGKNGRPYAASCRWSISRPIAARSDGHVAAGYGLTHSHGDDGHGARGSGRVIAEDSRRASPASPGARPTAWTQAEPAREQGHAGSFRHALHLLFRGMEARDQRHCNAVAPHARAAVDHHQCRGAIAAHNAGTLSHGGAARIAGRCCAHCQELPKD